MNDQNTKLSVVAYYLSKFDTDAINALGYKNQTVAIKDISVRLGSGNSYLKQRRDEFDVLTGSHRRGYANREPARGVLEMHNNLKDITFDDFTNIISQPILASTNETQNNSLEIDSRLSDVEIEAIINDKDSNSAIFLRQSNRKTRSYNPRSIENLKKLYHYRCQICECSTQEYAVNIVEAHHILPLSESQNNDSDNIIILCPNHHRLIHRANPVFERQGNCFVFSNDLILPIKLNLHL